MIESEKKISELIQATGGNITAREISEKLNMSISLVYKVVQRCNLKIVKERRKIYTKRYEPCKNRPQGCFECPYAECICNSKATVKETMFCQMM